MVIRFFYCALYKIGLHMRYKHKHKRIYKHKGVSKYDKYEHNVIDACAISQMADDDCGRHFETEFILTSFDLVFSLCVSAYAFVILVEACDSKTKAN